MNFLDKKHLKTTNNNCSTFDYFQMSTWAISKTTPGQFTGSTGANILTARELTAGQQAWVKRVCFICK